MKKICIFLMTLGFIVGCACTMPKASEAVKEYLNKYNNHDSEVLVELDTLIKEENLTEEHGKKYKEIMKKQYTDLKYEIVNETYNGDEAIVTTKVTVYDLYKVQKNAEEYKTNHHEEFLDENKKFDATKYLEYKLEEMKKNTDKVEYTIDFKVKKENGKWKVQKLSTEDLEKIHGIYNYQKD